MRHSFGFRNPRKQKRRPLFIDHVLGAHQKSAPLHHHPVDVLDLPVDDQILQPDLHPVPADVGGDDRHKEVARLLLHQERAEDIGRRHAGDVETPPTGEPRGGTWC